MNLLFDNVESLLEEAVQKTGKSKSKLLGLMGVPPTQYDRYIREKRLFSDSMLQSLGESEYFNATYQQLIAWKMADTYGLDNLGIAFYELFSALSDDDKRKWLESIYPTTTERREVAKRQLEKRK